MVDVVDVLSEQQLNYLMVKVWFDDGIFVEDVCFFNVLNFMEEVEVDFIEFYMIVVLCLNNIVQGFEELVFIVFEDGWWQQISCFEFVDDFLFNIGIMIDMLGLMFELFGEV